MHVYYVCVCIYVAHRTAAGILFACNVLMYMCMCVMYVCICVCVYIYIHV